MGETLEATLNDGTQIYGEQISHHPPISYFLVYGPENCYKYYGYYDYEAKAGLNSLQVINKGKRYLEFKNQKIHFNFPNEQYSGTLMGTLKQESYGSLVFTDYENCLKAEIKLNSVKGRPKDYFLGEIL